MLLDLQRAVAGLGAAGFVVPAGLVAPVAPPTPRAVFVQAPVAGPAVRVDMSGILDRHWKRVSSYTDAAGLAFVGGTLDLKGDGWLVVSPSGATPRMIKIEAGMSGEWTSGGRAYKATLEVNIFRARLKNILVITDQATGDKVWSSRILDLFRATYDAGLPVTVAGREYRLFLSRMPDASVKPAVPSAEQGLCFIYDEKDSAGDHVKYDFYRFPAESLKVPTSISLFNGDRATVQASSDLSFLDILP